ncbi:MAG: alpha/beta hydrolase [Candidatus Nanoarchaeia archaeon]
MASILLIHELGLSPDDGWYGWLDKEIDKRGHKLFCVSFPSNKNIDEWFSKVKEFLKFMDSDSMIIGHGFGTKVVLKVLQSKSRTIAATFLVAGSLGDEQYDFENIKSKSGEFFVYAGDKDEEVSIDDVEHLASMLDESVLLIPEAGHFDKITEFEDILVDIISVLNR